MLLINCLIDYGYETGDLDLRMKLRSEIFGTDLRKAFNKYKTVDNDRLTVHCLSYLNKAQCDADEFMAQFEKTEADMKTPLNLLQTVVEVLDEDPVAQDALLGLLTKMLCMCKTSAQQMKYIAAVDSLIEEAVTVSKGYSIDLDNVNFKGKEDKILVSTLKRGKERLEDELSHANIRLEKLSKLQTELEAHIETKSTRIQELVREKKAAIEELDSVQKEALEEIQSLKDELQGKENELKKLREFGTTAQMSNLNLNSPLEQEGRTLDLHIENDCNQIPPPPPMMMMSTGSCPPPPPPMMGISSSNPPPPPPPMMNTVVCPPPPPPMIMMNIGSCPPPPPPMMNNGICPPPPPPMIGSCPPPPPMGIFSNAPTAPLSVRIRPKPTGKTRQLQWEKLNQVKGTIWDGVDEIAWEKRIEYEGLEETFKYDPHISKHMPCDERRLSVSANGSSMMDPKKARNMQIILGRLKLSPNELRTSLLRMDESIWTDSIVHEIIKYLPNKSEQEEISKYFEDPAVLAAPKVTAERMAFELSKIVGLEGRLKSIELKANIGDWHIEALEQLNALLSGLDELKNGNSVKDFLGLALAVGNFLNSGTYKANASGFRIDSLLKIRDMKTTDGKSNLLVYLIEFISRATPELLSLPIDIKDTSRASNMSLDGMTEILTEKKRTISRLEKLSKDYKEGNYEDLNGGIDKYLEIIDPFIESARKHIESVEVKLLEASENFSEILNYFGDDGNFKNPQEFFSVFTDFTADFDRIKQELASAASSDNSTDMKKKISVAFKSQEKDGRNIIENVLGAARTAC